MKYTFKKDEGVKYIEEGSKLIPILLDDGWSCDDIQESADKELEALKVKADKLGIKYHHASGVKKLKELIKECE